MPGLFIVRDYMVEVGVFVVQQLVLAGDRGETDQHRKVSTAFPQPGIWDGAGETGYAVDTCALNPTAGLR